MKSRAMSTTTWAIIAAVVVIIVIGAVAAVLLVPHTKPTSTPSTTSPPSTSTTNVTSTNLVFYTWWATTGKVALNHLIPAFESSYPEYTVTKNLVPGAGGTNAKYAILALIEAGKPPAIFQSLVGANMLSYVESSPGGLSTFVNLTPVAQQEGLLSNTVLPVMEAASYNGTMLNVPVSVHSGLVLYYNLNLLREYNLPIPQNLTELTYDTVQLAKHGVTPWMVPGADGGYDQEQLWFAIFLSLGGPRLMDELLYGTLQLSNSTVQTIFNETNALFLNYTSYNYPGWQSMTWTQGIALVYQGKAAFEVDVDSATNYLYDFLNVTTYPAVQPYLSWSNVTMVAQPFPGTQNYFPIVSDAVALPVSSQQQAAITFIKYWTSYQGQEVWTKWKAVTYYKNGTDWYNTPQQYWMYQHLLNISPNNFVIDPLSLFADVDAQLYSGLLTLQQTGSSALPIWESQFNSSVHEEYLEWQTAAKLGLGYLGFQGHPFGGYYPPWVKSNDPSQSNSSAEQQYNLQLISAIIGEAKLWY
ncbi:MULTISPECIES: glucose ABC transporter substrate-binding protein GlcS [Metallosphaera]|uniref:glucose ABC transporter substrate-binding protein GlcS n=1 Tax=Metallosphaera TaxID=41980 RepID=UPI001F06BE9C|nr:glucose ABC transporter substrate-binding protein GlcS [Metallosphaera sedula]MCH1770441.1 extracellular solute-binding protein [Metallosphaera sedula]